MIDRRSSAVDLRAAATIDELKPSSYHYYDDYYYYHDDDSVCLCTSQTDAHLLSQLMLRTRTHTPVRIVVAQITRQLSIEPTQQFACLLLDD